MSSNWSTSTQQRASGLLNSIPGYTGYKDKERRRDVDKQVREKVAAALSTQADRVDVVARDLAGARQLAAIGPVDALAKQLRHLIDRIANATYGYGGLRSDRPIDEGALDQLRLFDESLFDGVDQLSAPIGALETAAAAGQELAGPIGAVDEVARKLGARLDLRGQIIETGKAAPVAEVDAALQVLKTPEQRKAEQEPPPAYALNQGDALAILGDNFIVDSRIEVDSTARSFRLFRIDAVPDRWLFVPNQQDGMHALLAVSTDSFTEQSLSIGSTSYRSSAAGSGTSEIAGAGGASNRLAVAFWLLEAVDDQSGRAVVLKWSGQTQVFTGTEVHSDDIEIFGPAKPS